MVAFWWIVGLIFGLFIGLVIGFNAGEYRQYAKTMHYVSHYCKEVYGELMKLRP